MTQNLKFFNSWRSFAIVIVAGLFYYFEFILRVAPSVMILPMTREFALSSGTFGTLAGAYYLAYTPAQLLVGLLIDRFGPRLLLILSSTLCFVGTFLFGMSSDFWILYLGRFLVGLGSAFAFVGSLKLVTLWFPQKWFATAAGIISGIGMVGGITATLILAPMVDNLGWRQANIITGWVGVIILLLIFFVVFEKKQSDKKVDSERNFRLLFCSLRTIIVKRNILIAGLIGAILYLSLSAFGELWGIPFLMEKYQISNLEASGAIAYLFTGWIVGGILLSWLSDFLENRKLILQIALLSSLIIFLMILYPLTQDKAILKLLLLLYGIASSGELLVFAVARDETALNVAGTATSVINMIVMLGGVCFQPVIGLLAGLVNKPGSETSATISTNHFQSALLVIPMALIIGLVLTRFFQNKSSKPLTIG